MDTPVPQTAEQRVESIPVETVNAAALDPTEDRPAPVAEPAAPAAAEAQPEGEDQRKPGKLPEWGEKLVRDKAAEAREAKRRVAELEAENATLKAREAAATPAAPSTADAEAARANAPAGGYKTQADFDKAVADEATRRSQQAAQDAAVKAFNDACDAAYNKGMEAYKDDFPQAVKTLQDIGVMTPEVLELVLASDDPAKVLYDLGSDPDKAGELLGMTPAKRAIEIAKLGGTTAPKRTAAPSNAPRPIPSVDGSARVTSEPRDDDDDDTWQAKRRAQIVERNKAMYG